MAALGSLVVSLAMDTAKFSGDVGKAARQMARLTAEAGKIGAAIGASIGTGLVAMTALVRQSIDAADATSKMAQSLGVSTEAMSQLAYAADLAGQSQEELGSSLGRLARQAADAAGGGKEASQVFSAMGVSVKNADGALKSTEQLLGDVADQFASYADGAAKTALAQELFGKSGAKMIPFLNQGRAGLADLAREADMLGITLTTGAGQAAEAFNDNLTRLSKAKEGLGRQIAERLLPMLSNLTSQLFDSAKNADLFGRAAEIAAAGVKLLVSGGAILVGVFNTIGTAVGGAMAAIVAAISGRFTEAWHIASGTVADFAGNVRSAAGTVSTIWDTTAGSIASKAPQLGGKLAAPLLTAADKAKSAGKAIKDELERLQEQYLKTFSALQFEGATFGASDRIKEILKVTQAVQQGLNPQLARDIIDQINANAALAEAAERTAQAERRRQDVLRDGVSVYDATRTPAEDLSREINRLNDLLHAGALSWDTYFRATVQAQDAFDAATNAAKDTGDDISKFTERARKNIQDEFGNTLVDAMNGNFKSIGDGFVQMLNRMVAEALAAKLAEAMFGTVGQSGSGAGGTGIFGSILQTIGNSLFGGKAYGGPVSAGRAYAVGEHGPELFVPATAGTVVPRSDGGMVLTVNVQAQPNVSRQSAMQQGEAIGRGIQLALARNG